MGYGYILDIILYLLLDSLKEEEISSIFDILR